MFAVDNSLDEVGAVISTNLGWPSMLVGSLLEEHTDPPVSLHNLASNHCPLLKFNVPVRPIFKPLDPV